MEKGEKRIGEKMVKLEKRLEKIKGKGRKG